MRQMTTYLIAMPRMIQFALGQNREDMRRKVKICSVVRGIHESALEFAPPPPEFNRVIKKYFIILLNTVIILNSL